MESSAESPQDIRLDQILSHARAPRLSPGLSRRVLDSIRVPEDKVTPAEEPEFFARKISESRTFKKPWLQMVAAIAVASVLWFAGRQTSVPSGEETWMQAFTTGEISSADLSLIAHLHEFIEAELSDSQAAWLE